MKLLLLLVAAQIAGNGITLLIAAALARVLRRRLVADRSLRWVDKLTDEQYDALYGEVAGEPELRKAGAPC